MEGQDPIDLKNPKNLDGYIDRMNAGPNNDKSQTSPPLIPRLPDLSLKRCKASAANERRELKNNSLADKHTQESKMWDSISSLGLDPENTDYIVEHGMKFLEKSFILAKKLKISQKIATNALNILKSSRQDVEIEIAREDRDKIETCLRENPEIEYHEDIALFCEIDEKIISLYFEMQPLTENEKKHIEEHYNKDISVGTISNILKISSEKVKKYIEKTLTTFSGQEGRNALAIIVKNFGEIPISKLREKIRSKNLKLQDQLCCILKRENKCEYETVMKYLDKFTESKEFLNVDWNLDLEDILVIKKSGKDNIEQLSSKLNKVESLITHYFMHQYFIYPVEFEHYNELQGSQIEKLFDSLGSISFSFNEYRMIITQSFDDIISKVEDASSSKKSKDLIIDILPLAFYYLKCSLPFEDIARIIANLSDINLTTHDIFHLIFQLSDPVLKGLCIEHYSFSNAVPLYYPKLKHSGGKPESTKFECCKELWYCLEQYNGLISFGLGRASWNTVGKSSLLDMIFETDFVKGSPQGSAFHFRSIDIQLTKNIFGESNRSSKESTKWAYIDCHGSSDLKIIQAMCSHLDVALIHVCYSDYESNRLDLTPQLRNFVVKHLYLLIRDSDCVEVSVKKEDDHGNIRTLVFIPDLTRTDVKLSSILKSMKQIGYEIFHLNIENPKMVNSKFLEEVLIDVHFQIIQAKEYNQIRSDKQLIQNITKHIEKTTETSNKIDFSFLNFYPTFVDYMSLYHQTSHQTNQAIIEVLNTNLAQLEVDLINTPTGDIVAYFNDILQQENSTLILWKLSRELFHLSKFIHVENNDTSVKNPNEKANTIREQKNDKYTLEIIWREALLTLKYGQDIKSIWKNKFNELLSSNFSKQVDSGEAFELIDGDNLRFFNKAIDTLLNNFYVKQSIRIEKLNEGKDVRIKPAPIVVSIFGPQSSGKSTLLNYCFGCKFLTSAGRCTRGIYGSLSKLDRPVNLSDSFLILDTEGLDAIERGNIKDTSMIHFDRTMVLFCLAVSQVVIINVKGDIGSELQNLLQICAFSLNRLKVSKVKAPKIFFVLNQQADPDPSKHLDAINLLLEKLNSESGLMETEGAKISDLIQVSRENLFILPSAFNSQQMNKPGAKLFDSNVIKLSPTIAFADKCSKLKLAIIDQLGNMDQDDRAPFNTMSEWMEMAGVIWDTIIKYQDIVKYKNLEEFMCSQKLSKVVSDLMEKYIYSNQQHFAELTNMICKEIAERESYKDPDVVLTEEMSNFEEEYFQKRNSCLREFSDICQNDSLLKKLDYICDDTASTIKRLIYVVRKQYEDQLKLQINSVMTEFKLSENMKKFQEAIIKHVDEYLEYTEVQQINAFEDTWNETFGVEDHNEEKLECEENFSNLYSIFRMEINAMENKQSIHHLFTNHGFNMDDIIQSIRDDLLIRFQEPNSFNQFENLTYSLTGYHTPLKEMLPYNGRPEHDYLCRDSLYQTDEAWYSTRLYNAFKVYPAKWVPQECHGLIKYCSGFENHPDVLWCPNRKKQITLLTSKLKDPKDLRTSTWEKFINDITYDTQIILDRHPDVSHAVVKIVIHEFCFRVKLLNYEIGYIHAGLSNTADILLANLIFSLTFKNLWTNKIHVKRGRLYKKNAKKQDHLIYFLQKIENRRMVRGSWNRRTMTESDTCISNKYASDYIESVKRGLMITEQHNLKKILQDTKESLSHEGILSLAENLVSEEVEKNPGEKVSDNRNDVVQFICNRNDFLLNIFKKEWEKVESTLHQKISENMKLGFQNETLRFKSVIKNLLSELDDTARVTLSINTFDAESNFEINEIGLLDPNKTKEIPFKAMNSYLKMYLDPSVDPETFKKHSSGFKVEGLEVRISDTYKLCCKPAEPKLDDDTFKILSLIGMFNDTELIFNLLYYVKQFKDTLDEYRVELSQEEFNEMISPLKSEFEKDMIGCPSQCPSCGKFCEREIHPNNGQCQITTGHQISSMGGKVWNTDAKKTAVLYMCDDYKDYTQILTQGDSISKWGDFKDKCSEWDWELSTDEKYKSKQNSYRDKMIKIWNKFGPGILNYYREKDGTDITFVPYTTYEEVNKSFLPLDYRICFVIDGTVSMSRDISRAVISVGQLVKRFASRGSSSKFRVVVYRDHCDANIIETFPSGRSFTDQKNTIEEFLSGVEAVGGGDFPEAVLDGLATAAKNSDWQCRHGISNKVIHIYDAPPHGDFPNYTSHDPRSNKKHCCCCNNGTKCNFEWENDVWDVFKKFNIEYHGINTNASFPEYESMMEEELGHLCGKFQVVGKEVVNDAVLQIFVDCKSSK